MGKQKNWLSIPWELEQIFNLVTVNVHSVKRRTAPDNVPQWSYRKHGSRDNRLSVVLNGNGHLTLADETYKTSSGTIFIYGSGTVQSGVIDEKPAFDTIQVFFEAFVAQNLSLLRYFPCPACFSGQTSRTVASLTKDMLSADESESTAFRMTVNTFMLRILDTIYHAPESDIVTPVSKTDHERPSDSERYREIVLAAIAKMVSVVRHSNPLSMSQLAEHVGVHPNHLTRVFNMTVGLPPARLLTDLRIGRARRELRQTAISIAQAGKNAGYPDPYHFSRVFKKATGTSPTEYRTSSGSHL